jgi:membrane protease YdiL (CAAX protease family)
VLDGEEESGAWGEGECAKSEEAGSAPRGVAPWWHTVSLLAGLTALTLMGASHLLQPYLPVGVLGSYGVAAVGEALMLLWVLFGLRLQHLPLRAILGESSFRPGAFFRDLGVAAVAWLCIMAILGTLNLVWMATEKIREDRSATVAMQRSTQPAQKLPAGLRGPMQKAVAAMAPSNGVEMLSWLLLCVLVGITEEMVFRGYLMSQFLAWFSCWPRLRVLAAVALASILFGGAHLYQGARGIVLITLFGAMLSVLALKRRSLRVGMMVHIGQDMLAGVGMAFLKSQHLI